MKFALVLTVFASGWIHLAVAARAADSYVVEYWADNHASKLEPVQAAPAETRSYRLSDLPLIQTEPSQLVDGDATYLLDREGLYRVRAESPPRVVRQSILYRENVWRFVGHLNRLYVYGARHQKEGQAKWDEHALAGEPLSLQCGFVSMFIHHHLSQQKIGSRLVSCATGSNWRHFDDGHALMEICDPVENRWVLYDPTLGARFRDGDRWLNLLEMTRRYRSGGHPQHIEFLNASPKIDVLVDYEAFYAEGIPDKRELPGHVERFKRLLQNDVPGIHRWYAKMMQVPIIDNYFVPESDAEDALFRTEPTWKNLVRLSAAQFREQFYDQPCGAADRTRTK